MRLRRRLVVGCLLGMLVACGNATPEDYYSFDGGVREMPDGGGTGVLHTPTPGYSPSEIDLWPLEGLVGGEPWQFQQGATVPALSVPTDSYAHFSSGSFTACQPGFTAGDGRVWTMLPLAGGEFYLFADNEGGESRSVVFNDPSRGELVASEGLIFIEEITATTIRGGLLADFDHENFINGQFVVDRCP